MALLSASCRRASRLHHASAQNARGGDGETVIVIDHDGLRNYLASSQRGTPFVERGGGYWGPPEDDAQAVRELERRRTDAGAECFALATS